MSTRKAPKRNAGGRNQQIIKRAKKWVDPLIGIGSKTFLNHIRSIGRKPEDQAAAKLRRRIAFTGGVVHHSKPEGEI